MGSHFQDLRNTKCDYYFLIWIIHQWWDCSYIPNTAAVLPYCWFKNIMSTRIVLDNYNAETDQVLLSDEEQTEILEPISKYHQLKSMIMKSKWFGVIGVGLFMLSYVLLFWSINHEEDYINGRWVHKKVWINSYWKLPMLLSSDAWSEYDIYYSHVYNKRLFQINVY